MTRFPKKDEAPGSIHRREQKQLLLECSAGYNPATSHSTASWSLLTPKEAEVRGTPWIHILTACFQFSLLSNWPTQAGERALGEISHVIPFETWTGEMDSQHRIQLALGLLLHSLANTVQDWNRDKCQNIEEKHFGKIDQLNGKSENLLPNGRSVTDGGC